MNDSQIAGMTNFDWAGLWQQSQGVVMGFGSSFFTSGA